MKNARLLHYSHCVSVEVEDGSRTVLSMGLECCVVRDPDGFPIELVQQPTLQLLPYEL